MTEFIGNFDPRINKPLDSRQFVADEEARLAIQYLNKGLLVYQEDNDTWYQPLVNEATLDGSGGAYTILADWKEAPLLGATGANGADGVDGATILTDEGIPGDEIGQNGDLYFDELSNDLYQKEAGTWGSPIANLKGDTGTGLVNRGAWSAIGSYDEGDYVFDESSTDPLVNSLYIFQGTGPYTDTDQPKDDTANWAELQAPAGPQGPAGDPFEIDSEVNLNDALVASIESTSGGTALQPYRVAVLNDTRTSTTNNATATYVEIQGNMEGRVIAWNGTTWDNYAQFRGPQGETGYLIGGSSNQTARYNGSTGEWEANSVLRNNGTNVAIGASTPFTDALNVTGSILITGGYKTSTTKIVASGLPSAYPNGISYFSVGSGDGYPTSSGTIKTIKASGARVFQYFYAANDNRIWVRSQTTTNSDLWETFYEITGLLNKSAGFAKVVNGTTGEMSTVTTVDYNTEIANLPTIPTAASELEAEAEVISNKYISPATLGQWFTDTKANDAQTWTLKQTFTAAPRFSSVTASHFLKVDGNKDLTSQEKILFSDILGTTDSVARLVSVNADGSISTLPVITQYQVASTNPSGGTGVHYRTLYKTGSRISIIGSGKLTATNNNQSSVSFQVMSTSDAGGSYTSLDSSSFPINIMGLILVGSSYVQSRMTLVRDGSTIDIEIRKLDGSLINSGDVMYLNYSFTGFAN
jgi:hypothetical protein